MATITFSGMQISGKLNLNTEGSPIVVPADAYFRYNTLLLNGDIATTPWNTFTSNNVTNYNATIFGDARPSNYNPYTAGYYSNYFDGTGDYLSINYSSGSSIAGDFTWETWAYDTVATAYGTLMGWRNGSSGWSGFIIQRNNGQNNLTVSINSAGGLSLTQTSGTYAGNVWNHVALVRSGSNVNLYVNGVAAGSGTYSGTFDPGSSYWIGSDPYNNVAAVQLQGYISNQRFVNGTAIYTGSPIAVPTSPLQVTSNTHILTSRSNRLIDEGVRNYAVTKNGDVRVSQAIPFDNPTSVLTNTKYSTYFDATGDYLSVPNSTPLNLSSGNFTIEAWVWFNPLASYTPVIFNKDGVSGSFYVSYQMSLAFPSSFYVLSTYVATGAGSAGQQILSATEFPSRQWVHCAFVRTGTTLTIYQNGVSVANVTQSTAIVDAGRPLLIGYEASGPGTYYFPGFISDARIVKGDAVYTGNFTPPNAPLLPYGTTTTYANSANVNTSFPAANTSLLTCQNDIIIDNSIYNANITSLGDAQPVAVTPYTQTANTVTVTNLGSGYFDGTGDYLTIPPDAAFAPGTGDFTVEGWIYPTNLMSGSSGVIFSQAVSGTNYFVIFATNGAIQFWGTLSGGGSAISSGSNSWALNTWNHFAVVRRSGSVKVYLNGIAGTAVADTNNYTNTTYIPTIGRYTHADSNLFFGHIADLRYIKGEAVYKANFAPPVQPLTANYSAAANATANVSLLALKTSQPQNNSTYYDSSRFNNLITRNGDTGQGSFTPFGNRWSAYFSSASNYVYGSTFTSGGGVSVGATTAVWTFECWVKPTSSAVGGYIFAIGNGSAYGNGFAFAWNYGVANKFRFLQGNTGTNVTDFYSTNSYPAGVWYHVAVTRTSAGVMTIYVNGVADGTQTQNASGVVDGPYCVFNNCYDNGGFNSGGSHIISNFRFVNGRVLYTSTFTPSTTPLTAISGTLLLACQSNRFVDNGPYKIPLTSVGTNYIQVDSPIDSESQYYSKNIAGLGGRDVYGGSVLFDGTGDYLTIPTTAAFGFGTGDYTIEFYMYLTASPASSSKYTLLDFRPTGSVPHTVYVNNSAGTLYLGFYNGSADTTSSSQPVTINSWVHCVWARSSGVIKIFVNGVQAYSGAMTTDYLTTRPLTIGSGVGGQEYMFGYMSNFRIVKGTAVYTGNFTPPTAPVLTYNKNEMYPSRANVNTSFSASNTSLLLNFADGAIYDATKSTNYYTIGNTGVVTANSKFGGTSMYFDGSGDAIVSGPNQYNFGNTDFTVEMWYNKTGTPQTSGRLFQTRNGDLYSAISIGTNGTGSDPNNIGMSLSSDGSTWNIVSVNAMFAVSDNTWTHIALVRTGTNFNVFKDGNIRYTFTSAAALYYSAADSFIIGGQTGTSRSLTGYIDDFRITANARYTANFTPAISTFFTQ
jgi:hypothetical protein